MDPPDPIEALKFRMSQQKLTRKQLEPIVPSSPQVFPSQVPQLCSASLKEENNVVGQLQGGVNAFVV